MLGRLNAAFSLIFLIFTTAIAQKVIVVQEDQESERFFHTNIAVGAVMTDIEDINTQMESRQLPKISDNGLSLGIGMSGINSRFINITGLEAIVWGEGDRGNRETHLAALVGRTSFGYDLLPSKRLRLYPYLGLGIGVMRLRINQENISFDDAISEQSPTRNFLQLGALIGGGVGLSYTFGIDGNKRNIVLGLRGGFWYDPTAGNDWYIKRADVQNGPDAGFTGPYATIIIGRELSVSRIRKRWKNRIER